VVAGCGWFRLSLRQFSVFDKHGTLLWFFPSFFNNMVIENINQCSRTELAMGSSSTPGEL